MTSINPRQLVISIATVLRSRFTIAAVATILALVLTVRIALPLCRHIGAINAINRMGGRCKQTCRRSPLDALKSLDIRPDDFVPVDVIELGAIFQDARLTEGDMRRVCELSEVYKVEIWCDRCDERCLAHLQSLPDLQRLTIRCREIDDLGLMRLASLSGLEQLDLEGTLTDEPGPGLTCLKRRFNGADPWNEYKISSGVAAKSAGATPSDDCQKLKSTAVRIQWFAQR